DDVSTGRRIGLAAFLLGAAACDHRIAGLYGGEEAGEALPPGATPVPTVVVALPPAPPPAAPAASQAALVATPVQPLSFAPIARLADQSVVTITTVGVEEEISPFTHRRR